MTTASGHDRLLQPRGTQGLQPGLIEIREVDLEAPWRWIVAGWRDLTRMPGVSLTYGAVFALAAGAMLAGLTQFGLQSIILALAGGFLLIGPVLAVGLYQGSKRLEEGKAIRASDIFLAGFRAPGQLALLGLALFLIYFVWVRIALLLFMFFFGLQPFPPLDQFISTLLLTVEGVMLLVVGTVVGASLAALVFAICAVSAPMLTDRPVGATTAIHTSVRAVMLNWKPMALWATLIVGFLALGIMTLFAGLVVVFPLIGHATWHAYRDMVADGESRITPSASGRA
jgi:uncharacterized membrane protein